jgi:hypothetical protein
LYASGDGSCTRSIDIGHHNSVAIDMYKMIKGCDIQLSGIWLDRSGCIGGSPDGIVGDNVIIEVKCRHTLRETMVTAALDKPGFMLTKDSGSDIGLNTSADLGAQYFHQMQGNLYMTNRSSCDLLVWTPHKMVIVNVEKDVNWGVNLDLLKNLYCDTYLPVFMAGGL